MAIKTSTFSVNNTGNPEAVTATIQSLCVIIGEDASVAGWPTTDYTVQGSLADTAVRKSAGTTFAFEQSSDIGQPRKYNPGETVGYVATVSGTTTFMMIEIY